MARSRSHYLFFICSLLLLTTVVAEFPVSVSAASNSQAKALSFLENVIGLDMSKYAPTLAKSTNSGSEEDFTYYLQSSSTNHLDANFMFFNGKLGQCNFGQFGGPLLYSLPESDQYNQTLRLIRNYGQWLDDPQTVEMANMFSKLDSIHNATEFSGNLTMKLVVYQSSMFIKFSNTVNDVDYTGLQIVYGSFGSFYFDDSRTYLTIGNTSINISKEQAILIAKDYVQNNYSYNGVIVRDLNVTNVGTVHLTTKVDSPTGDYVGGTISPYWYVKLNVENMPRNGLEGLIVELSANDGKVLSSTPFGDPPTLTQLLPNNFWHIFGQVWSFCLIALGFILIIIGLLRRSKRKNILGKSRAKQVQPFSFIVHLTILLIVFHSQFLKIRLC